MAEDLPTWRQSHCQFGDQNTADVKLRLICSDGAEYLGNPLYLHSTVLRKSEFYKTMLSERWSSDKRPFEAEVTCSHSVDKYIKCFELMYFSQKGESLRFSTVDEALDILPVACELLFHVYIEDCMQYLNAVRWTAAQEAQLRALIPLLQINTWPDLAARLDMSPCNSECEHLEMLEEFLPDMLSLISAGTENLCTTVEKYIVDYFKEIASPAIAENCKSALLKEFRANMDLIISNNTEAANMDLIISNNTVAPKMKKGLFVLLWLVRVIQRCDGNLFKSVLQMFCEDSDFRNSLDLTHSSYMPIVNSGEIILDILINHFLKAMVNGDIITPTSFRHSFLTNWINIMVALLYHVGNHRTVKMFPAPDNRTMAMLSALENGIACLAETLPLANQRCIYKVWKDTFEKYIVPECNAYEWWAKKLHDAIISHH